MRAFPRCLIAISAITAVPIEALQVIATLSIPGIDDQKGSRQTIAAVLQLLPALILVPISAAAATVASIDALNGRAPSVGRSMDPVGGRFIPMALAIAVGTTVAVAALFPLVVPGIYLLILFLFAGQIAVLERIGPIASLKRSAQLVRGGWWRVFGMWLVVSLTTGLVALAAGRLSAAATNGLSDNVATILNGVVGALVLTVANAVAITALAVLYTDRRVRQERRWPTMLPLRVDN